MADEGICAVGTGAPAGVDGRYVAGGGPLAIANPYALELYANLIFRLFHALSAPPLTNFDVRQRLDVRVHHPLELRLSEHVGDRPAARPHAARVEVEQHLAVGVAPLVAVARFGDPGDVRHQAGGLENACDLMIEVDGTRKRIKVGPALDDDDFVAKTPEQQSQRLTRRTIADDNDIGNQFVRHAIPPSCFAPG